MRMLVALALLTFAALTTGCGSASAAGPDPSVVQAGVATLTYGPLTFFKKLNGESREFMGQKIYVFHWVAGSLITAKNVFAWWNPNGPTDAYFNKVSQAGRVPHDFNITIGTPEEDRTGNPLSRHDPTCKPEDKKKNFECPITLTDAKEAADASVNPSGAVVKSGDWQRFYMYPGDSVHLLRGRTTLKLTENGWMYAPEATTEGALYLIREGFCRTPSGGPKVTVSACYEARVAKLPNLWQ